MKSDTGDVNADRGWRPSYGETKREKDWAFGGGGGAANMVVGLVTGDLSEGDVCQDWGSPGQGDVGR